MSTSMVQHSSLYQELPSKQYGLSKVQGMLGKSNLRFSYYLLMMKKYMKVHDSKMNNVQIKWWILRQ